MLEIVMLSVSFASLAAAGATCLKQQCRALPRG